MPHIDPKRDRPVKTRVPYSPERTSKYSAYFEFEDYPGMWIAGSGKYRFVVAPDNSVVFVSRFRDSDTEEEINSLVAHWIDNVFTRQELPAPSLVWVPTRVFTNLFIRAGSAEEFIVLYTQSLMTGE